MNRLLRLTLIIVAATLGTSSLSLAVDTDDQKIVTIVDKDADRFPKDNEKQDLKLAKEFNVKEIRIDSLRKQGLGYGEIRHVLTITKQMPGGINNANVKKVMGMRQGGEHKEGWGRIAQDLGVKLHNENNEHLENRNMPHESTKPSHSVGASMGGGMGHKGK